jgi:class 3 adenylate cyclase/alpha-beta hydrolase superfamily lysophospholipase
MLRLARETLRDPGEVRRKLERAVRIVFKRPRTHYARSGQLNIAYQVLGEGPIDLVVVPPGLAIMDTSWEDDALSAFWSALAAFSRLILLDKRGTGLSDRVTGVPTLEERMDDVRVVMEAVGSERAALLGGSEAAPITALFAATYPERTSALVLINALVKWSASPDFPWAFSDDTQRQLLDYVEQNWGSGLAGETWFAPSLAGDPRAREWVGRVECATGTPSTMATQLTMNALIDIRPALGAISAPTLVVHRSQDRVADVHHGRYCAENIVGAKYVELPGADHWWWIGDSEAVIDQIQEFLTGRRHQPEIERVLKTVLFTDIVASTEQASQLGDRRWRELLDKHDRAIRLDLERYRGEEVNTTGDGFLACFDGPARAIRCAQAMIGAARPLGIEIRVGLHTGECELRGSDLAGIAVHVGARVAALADAGEVLVTSTVRDLVAGSGIEFEERGRHSLKGVPGTWTLLRALPD